MDKSSDIEGRLVEYGSWRRHPIVFGGSPSIFSHIAEMKENMGFHGEGFAPEIIDGVMCRPDGGLANAVSRMSGILAFDLRGREVHEAMQLASKQMRALVLVTYIQAPTRRPRSRALASQLMSIGEREYRTLRDQTFGFLWGMLGYEVTKSAVADSGTQMYSANQILDSAPKINPRPAHVAGLAVMGSPLLSPT